MRLIRSAAVGVGTVGVLAGALLGAGPAQAGYNDYTLMYPQYSPPARWNPCRVITWDSRAVPRAERGRLTAAFGMASSASGIRFRAVRRKADIAVKFQWKNETTGVAGMGGASIIFHADGTAYRGRGKLWFTPPRTLSAGEMGALYLHEIGHVIGLGHSTSPDEIMYPVMQPGIYDYGAGDRHGMAVLGAKGGCVKE